MSETGQSVMITRESLIREASKSMFAPIADRYLIH